MSAAHQQFSARTRQSGELEKPAGVRRRNLETGRLSVVFGSDAACVLVDLAAKDNRSVGGFIRKIVLQWLLEHHKLDRYKLEAKAAELRAARLAAEEQAAIDELSEAAHLPAPGTPAAV